MNEPEAESVNRQAIALGQWKLLGIFLIAFMPMCVATAMYVFDWRWSPALTNHGELLTTLLRVEEDSERPNRHLRLLQEPLTELPEQKGKWRLVVTAPEECSEACRSQLHMIRQINTALGREAHRVERQLWVGFEGGALPAELETQYPEMSIVTVAKPQWQHLETLTELSPSTVSGRVWLVDPVGVVVMHYDPANVGKPLLRDLQRLMKLSKIG